MMNNRFKEHGYVFKANVLQSFGYSRASLRGGPCLVWVKGDKIFLTTEEAYEDFVLNYKDESTY